MAIRLTDQYAKQFVNENELEGMAPQVSAAHRVLQEKTGLGNDFLGWLSLPRDYDKAEFDRILAAAGRIKKNTDVFIVIGIGGSYLGARAAVEFIHSPVYNQLKKDTPDIYFAGNSLSSSAIGDLLSLCEGKDVSVNVISKSGTTTEPAIAFRIFREYLEKKYGDEEAKKRIFCTTDKAKGTLKQLADNMGYESFVVPDDIGGRFSVLTAVGLLPIAVSGADIAAMMQGAFDAMMAYQTDDVFQNDCYRYAALRNIFYRKGLKVELLASYESRFAMMAEWWKQLFGESEGKDHKGLFPASVVFSTDLHSMGQYVQDGVRMLLETVVTVGPSGHEIKLNKEENNGDGLNFLAGRSVDFINQKAFEGTVLAHNDGGVPNLVIGADKADEYHFGGLVYFFEKACAVSGYLLGVNPFNQPGVEDYKRNMFALLGKPGYEAERDSLMNRIQG